MILFNPNWEYRLVVKRVFREKEDCDIEWQNFSYHDTKKECKQKIERMRKMGHNLLWQIRSRTNQVVDEGHN